MNPTDYPLPDWAERLNQDKELIPGTQLMTKNGACIGNARIVAVAWKEGFGYVFTCRSDIGNQFLYTVSELYEQFTVGPYILKQSELTARKEVIHTCRTCRYRDHKGAFGNPSCIPCCRHLMARNEDGTSPELPYEGRADGSRVHAVATEVIPAWCPLEFN